MIQLEKDDVVCCRIQKIYLLLASWGTLSVLLNVTDFTDPISRRDGLESVVVIVMLFCIYIGLRARAEWVVSLILFFSAFGLFTAYLNGIQQAETVKDLVSKLVKAMYILFYTYQLIFFSKNSVKHIFGATGTVIF